MKRRFLLSLFVALFATGLSVSSVSYATESETAAMDEFKWSDEATLKTHLNEHVTYPATGKAIKEACRKEIPDEFSKEERAYFDAKIQDDVTYNSSAEVLAALNVK
ncbi:MAG TPA: hypothetical protein VIT21_09735 [Chthoniobacterales bacterium]